MDVTELNNRFRFHPADTPEKQSNHESIRETMLAAAHDVISLMPEGREQSLAITHLEEAMMWANAGIARAS